MDHARSWVTIDFGTEEHERNKTLGTIPIPRSAGFPKPFQGLGDPLLRGVNTLQEAKEGEISFLTNPKYKAQLFDSKASAAIVALDEAVPEELPLVRCQDPYGAMAASILCIHGTRRHAQWGRDPRAEIAPSARIGANVNIAPFVTIDADVVIEALCDFVESRENEKIRVIKDIAAAATGISILIWLVVLVAELSHLWSLRLL